MENFFKRFDRSMEFANNTGTIDSLKLLIRLNKYISELSFTNYSRAGELIRYRTVSSSVAGDKMGIGSTYYRQKMSEISNHLWGMFGKDFFDRLDRASAEDITHCNLILENVENQWTIDKFLDSSTLNFIKNNIDLEDLEKLKKEHNIDKFVEEIKFLSDISIPTLTARLSNLSGWKILYLLGVLDGTIGTNETKTRLVTYLIEKAGDEL